MRKHLKELFTITILITVILSANVFAFRPILDRPSSLPVATVTANGLNTTTFDTLVGTVTVNLPDDLAAGDTISGTVIAEVKKPTDQAKNEAPRDQPISSDEISGYVVEVAKQASPLQKQAGNQIDFCKSPRDIEGGNQIDFCKSWKIPEGVTSIPVVLKKDGIIVGKADVPVAPKAAFPIKLQDPKYSTPTIGQAGKPISIKGQMGNFEDTAIKIGSQSAKFLASSPRKMVVESPRDLKGVADILVEYKGKTVAKCTYRSITIKLAADKLNLIKGEQTNLTVNVAGLMSLLSPVSVQLTNKSPGTVSMAGGESQIINISPRDVNGDNFTTKRTLTGVKAGGFSITAVVDPTAAVEGECISAIAGNMSTLPNLPAPNKQKFEKEMDSLKMFAEKLQPALITAQKKLGFDPKAMEAEFRSIIQETDAAKRKQREAQFNKKYEPQFIKLAQTAGIDIAEQRRLLISLLDLSNAQIKEGKTLILELPGNSMEIPDPTPTPTPTPTLPGITERIFRAPFTYAGTYGDEIVQHVQNADGSTSPSYYAVSRANAATGDMSSEATAAILMSLYKGAFIEQSLPVESGFSRVRVSATLDPLYYDVGTGILTVYASAEAVVKLRVMEGSREVCRDRLSLGRAITVGVGFGTSDSGYPGRSRTLECEFTRPSTGAAATYTMIAEIEGWAASGGWPAFARVVTRTNLRQFHVTLHRD